jgi:RecQ-mediated genome instability protein 1
MDVPPSIQEWVNKEFPKPKVDPNWLRACYDYLYQEMSDNSDVNLICRNISHQILHSRLEDSMIAGTGLPNDFSDRDNTVVKFGPRGILLELVSLTDVGVSAFNQLNTYQVRIDRADLAGIALQREEADGRDPEEEGPIPKYQRSMLELELSDGVTTIKAIEHKRLPNIELGETPLGTKASLAR